MPTKVQDKVSPFLSLHNDVNKNLLLSNIVVFNVLRNSDDDDVDFGKTFPMASTIDETWI